MHLATALRDLEDSDRVERARQNPNRRPAPDPLDARLECPLGRARVRGLISEAEYQAGVGWRNVYLGYLASIGAPWPFSQSLGLGLTLDVAPPDPNDMTDEECEIAKTLYQRGVKILTACGRRVLHAVNALAVFEEPEELGDFEYTLRAARIGLSALAAKF